MNLKKNLAFATVLVLVAGTAGVLAHAKSNQKFGLPGVKTRPLANSKNLEVVLPAEVPGYKSEARDQADIVLHGLPVDTSFGQRIYTAEDGFQFLVNVVLMGSSRGSIHKPQVCLTAQGWNINEASSREEIVHLNKPMSYDLPVMRLNATRRVEANGQSFDEQGVYVYWFVDEDRFTASHAQRMLWMAHDVLFKSELDRWAYVAYFAVCPPGQQDAAFARIKQLIMATVPEFQLVPQPFK
jgi:Protein of unknown function (DUF3485)